MSSINDYIKKAKVQSFCLTKFLDTKESSDLRKIKDPEIKIFYYGGYSEAERVRAFIIERSEQAPEENEFEISVLKVTLKSDMREITHRHILGTLMSFGIKRELIGDILVSDNIIYIFTTTNIESFIKENLKEINRIPVEVSSIVPSDFTYQTNEKEVMLNVASLRLDCVVSKVLNFSRNKAVELIEQGLIQINHIECKNISYLLKTNDLLSIRHFGRVEIKEVINKTKKDRLILQVIVKH